MKKIMKLIVFWLFNESFRAQIIFLLYVIIQSSEDGDGWAQRGEEKEEKEREENDEEDGEKKKEKKEEDEDCVDTSADEGLQKKH